jgi:hypothetical protein
MFLFSTGPFPRTTFSVRFSSRSLYAPAMVLSGAVFLMSDLAIGRPASSQTLAALVRSIDGVRWTDRVSWTLLRLLDSMLDCWMAPCHPARRTKRCYFLRHGIQPCGRRSKDVSRVQRKCGCCRIRQRGGCRFCMTRAEPAFASLFAKAKSVAALA